MPVTYLDCPCPSSQFFLCSAMLEPVPGASGTRPWQLAQPSVALPLPSAVSELWLITWHWTSLTLPLHVANSCTAFSTTSKQFSLASHNRSAARFASASSVLRTCAWPAELRRACQPVSSFSQCVWMCLTLQCELVQGELLLLFPSPVFYAPCRFLYARFVATASCLLVDISFSHLWIFRTIFSSSRLTKCCKLQHFCVLTSFAGTMQKRRKCCKYQCFLDQLQHFWQVDRKKCWYLHIFLESRNTVNGGVLASFGRWNASIYAVFYPWRYQTQSYKL